MTAFHVGASNQPCGIQTPQPGPAVSHGIIAARPGRPQELLMVGGSRLNSDNYTGLYSTGIMGILLLDPLGQAQRSTGLIS